MESKLSIHKRRAYIKHLGEQLTFRQLSKEDTEFLSKALVKIGNGEDPATALDVKGRRGQSSGRGARASEERKELAKLTLLLAREGFSVSSEKGANSIHRVKGDKLTLENAAAKYGDRGINLFKLTEETLKTFYAEAPLSDEEIRIILKYVGGLVTPKKKE